MDRVNELIRNEVALILQRHVDDKRIGFVSILTADVSSDLSAAKITYSQIGSDAEMKATKKGLREATGYIQALLRKRVHLKVIPTLRFEYDSSIAKGSEVIAKLNTLSK